MHDMAVDFKLRATLHFLLQKFEPILSFFLTWERSVYSSTTGSPAADLPPFSTLADLKTTIRGMICICEYAMSVGMGIIPQRMSQDVLESWFGHHRQSCGSNHNMTGMSIS
jgi:hypothetical protein